MGCFRPKADWPVFRAATTVLLLLVIGAVPCLAQGRSGAIVDIEGPLSVVSGEEALLTAAYNEATVRARQNGATLEWLINGTTRSTGDILRCTSRIPATYRITLNLVSESGGRRAVLARDQHTLTFLERQPESVLSAAPPQAPSARWVLKGNRDWVDQSHVGDTRNSVTLNGNEYAGTSFRPCVGTVQSIVRWNEMPATLEPGTTLALEIQQEMLLTDDPDPNCEPAPRPRVTANAKFFVLTEARHERILDSISETARAQEDRFSKSKLVQWKVPTGRIRDEMTVEIGGESPAGSASRFYTYEFKPVETARPAAPAGVASTVRVALESSAGEIPLGTSARVHATVAGGRRPYRFSWSIRGMALSETGDTLTVRLARAGSQTVAVRVTDADGLTARDEVSLMARPPAVRLLKRSPAGNRLFIEETAELECELYTEYPAEAGEYAFRWQSDSGAEFNPPQSVEPATTLRFMKPGPSEIWVDVLYRTDSGKYEPVSRSEPLRFTVAPPEVTITLQPLQPYVGQEVRAVVVSKPEQADLEYRWSAVPANAVILSRAADFREIRFSLKTNEPAEFRVSAVLPRFEQVVAEAAAKVTARKYRVTIRGPEKTDNVPKVWRTGTGLVPLEGRYAVDQPVTFKAELAPSPPKGVSLVYEWRSSSPACTIRDPDAPSPVVICSSTGRYTIAATVRDANGIELGAARTTMEVVVSAKELEDSVLQARAQELRDQGYELLRLNKTGEALAAYRESLTIWPSEEVRKHIEQIERQVSQQEALTLRAGDLKAEGERLHQAGDIEAALDRFRASIGLASDPDLEARIARMEQEAAARKQKQVDAKTLQNEGRNLEDRGKLQEALEAYARSITMWPDKELEDRMAALREKMASEEDRRTRASALRDEAEALEKSGQSDQALAKYRLSLKAWPDTAVQKRIWTLEGVLKNRQENQTKAAALRDEAQALLNAKKYDEAIKLYQQSLQLVPDAELEAQTQQLAAALENRRHRQAEAQRLLAAGRSFEEAGRLNDAAESYKAGLREWTMDELETGLAGVEKRLAQQQERTSRARALEQEGARLEREGRIQEAIAKFRDSQAVVTNDALKARVAALEETLRQQEKNRQTAARLRGEGEALEKDGRIEQAILKFRESTRVSPDKILALHADELEQEWRKTANARATADRLRDEASVLLLKGEMDQAVAKFKESLAAYYTKDLEDHIRALEEESLRVAQARSEAEAFAQDAVKLEAAGKTTEALDAYRKSVELFPDEVVKERLSNLETSVREAEIRRTRVATLREEAAAVLLENRLEEAVSKYRESLRLQPDAALEARVQKMEERLKKRRAIAAEAAQLNSEADALEKEGRLEDAAAKYSRSLKLHVDDTIQRRLQDVETRIRAAAQQREAEAAQRKATEATARKLREEGEKLDRSGLHADALAKFRASLDVLPDPRLEARIAEIEKAEAAAAERRQQAMRLRDEAQAQLLDQKVDEAIRKYKESLTLVADPELQKTVKRLEEQQVKEQAALAAAKKLAENAAALEKQGKLEQAAAKLRESLQLQGDSDASARLAAIETRLNEMASAATAAAAAELARKEAADKLKMEGKRLEDAGKLADAIGKYRGSLDLVTDKNLAEQVESLQKRVQEQERVLAAAQQLERQAGALERAGRWPEAIAKLNESLKLRPDQLIATRVTELEEKLRKLAGQKERARALFEEAGRLEKDGKLEEAIARYNESLKLRADAEVRARAEQVETLIREKETQRDTTSAAMNARLASAERLRTDAERLETEGQTRESIAKYRASLDIWPDSDIEARIEALERSEQETEDAAVRARELENEAAALEQAGRLEEAIGKYGEIPGAASNALIAGRVHILKARLRDEEHRRAQAADAARKASRIGEAIRLRDEANLLNTQGKTKEALEKYRASLSLQPDDALKAQVEALETQLAQIEKDRELASRLRREAEDLERNGRLEDALNKYRESLSFESDPVTQDVVSDLQARIAKEAARTETANRLWREGITLAKKGQKTEGLVILKQSLALHAPADRTAVVKDIERQAESEARRAKSPAPVVSKQPAPPASPIKVTVKTDDRKAEPKKVATTPARKTVEAAAPRAPEPIPVPRVSTPPRAPTGVSGTRWKGVILIHTGNRTLQWPLRVTVGHGNDISGSYRERDPVAGEMADFTVGGVFDPSSGTWYVAVQRKTPKSTMKATLIGNLKTQEAAGGSVSMTPATAQDESQKGIWRIMREPM